MTPTHFPSGYRTTLESPAITTWQKRRVIKSKTLLYHGSFLLDLIHVHMQAVWHFVITPCASIHDPNILTMLNPGIEITASGQAAPLPASPFGPVKHSIPRGEQSLVPDIPRCYGSRLPQFSIFSYHKLWASLRKGSMATASEYPPPPSRAMSIQSQCMRAVNLKQKPC